MLFEEQHRKFFIFYGTDHNPQSVQSKRVANGRASWCDVHFVIGKYFVVYDKVLKKIEISLRQI